MATFNSDELRALLAVDNLPLVTIMMPLAPIGSNQRENHARLKNLLRQAETMIATFEMKSDEISAFLAPVQALLDGNTNNTPLFGSGMGAAFFLTTDPADFRYYTVDFPIEEKVTASDWFTIKPILPALTDMHHFYLLKLSQKQFELLEGTRTSLTAIDVTNTGGDAAGDPQSVMGEESAAIAEHGSGEDDSDKFVQQFMHRVNEAIQPLLNEKTAPLIVVAVEALHPLFRQANTYKHVVEPGIMGNPASFTQQVLIEKALELLAPLAETAKADAADRYQAGLHRKQASKIPIDVLQAANMGQVDMLFVALDVQMWGVFDLNTNVHELHTEERPGDVDLLDLAASKTILNHGTVYAVPREQMPDDAAIVAVYRYALEGQPV